MYQAVRAGFTGGLVVDYPNSTKAKKWVSLALLVLMLLVVFVRRKGFSVHHIFSTD